MNRGIHFTLERLAACAALLATAIPSWATSQTFSLVGSAQSISVTQTELPGSPDTIFTIGVLRLSDAVTGQTEFPGYELSIGDHVSVQVTLDGPLTVPAGTRLDGIFVDLGRIAVQGEFVLYDGHTSLFSQGQLVVPSSGFVPFAGTGGSVGVGGYDFSTPFLGLTFDAITADFTVTGLSPASSLPMQVMPSQFLLGYQVPTVVPEPAAQLLMLAGLAAGWTLRRKLVSAP